MVLVAVTILITVQEKVFLAYKHCNYGRVCLEYWDFWKKILVMSAQQMQIPTPLSSSLFGHHPYHLPGTIEELLTRICHDKSPLLPMPSLGGSWLSSERRLLFESCMKFLSLGALRIYPASLFTWPRTLLSLWPGTPRRCPPRRVHASQGYLFLSLHQTEIILLIIEFKKNNLCVVLWFLLC